MEKIKDGVSKGFFDLLSTENIVLFLKLYLVIFIFIDVYGPLCSHIAFQENYFVFKNMISLPHLYESYSLFLRISVEKAIPSKVQKLQKLYRLNYEVYILLSIVMMINYNQEPLSEDLSDLENKKDKEEVAYRQNYGQIQSEVSEPQISKLSQHSDMPEPIHLKPHEQNNFQLRLPSRNQGEAEEDKVEDRGKSRQGRHGRIKIDKTDKDENHKEKAIKLFNLDDEVSQKQEEVLETVNKNIVVPVEETNTIQIRITPTKQMLQKDMQENNSNAWIQHKQVVEGHLFEKKIQSEEHLIIPEQKEEKQEIVFVDKLEHPPKQKLYGKKERLVNIASGTSVHLGKGLFYNSVEDGDEKQYTVKKVPSNQSLQTSGMNSSRDEFSSRFILDPLSPERRKGRRLESLRPVNQVLNRKQEKIFQLQTYDNLNDMAQKNKYRRILAHGKYAILKHEIDDLLKFIYQPIPFDKCLETTITRNKQCSKLGYIDYDMETTDGLYLLSSKKMPFHMGSTYHISLAKNQFDENSAHFLGKVQGNFVGSVFNVSNTLSSSDNQKADELDATICYSSGWSCCKVEARKVEVYLKNKSFKYHELEGSEDKKNLQEMYQIGENKRLKKVIKFVNKQPVWIPSKEVYVLNFRGKVKYSSVKNMIIVNEQDEMDEGLLTAKKGDNEFAFDIQYPFTPLIALGVLMTSFDFKLASQ